MYSYICICICSLVSGFLHQLLISPPAANWISQTTNQVQPHKVEDRRGNANQNNFSHYWRNEGSPFLPHPISHSHLVTIFSTSIDQFHHMMRSVKFNAAITTTTAARDRNKCRWGGVNNSRRGGGVSYSPSPLCGGFLLCLCTLFGSLSALLRII